eukprot:m.6037 g.6037  ORF g.6037 m.6037 type:complete len:159 (+) comp2534_c1_seq1:138-614(+)
MARKKKFHEGKDVRRANKRTGLLSKLKTTKESVTEKKRQLSMKKMKRVVKKNALSVESIRSMSDALMDVQRTKLSEIDVKKFELSGKLSFKPSVKKGKVAIVGIASKQRIVRKKARKQTFQQEALQMNHTLQNLATLEDPFAAVKAHLQAGLDHMSQE